MKKQVIEFNGEAVGAAVPEGERFRFIAVKYAVWSLDGRVFSGPAEARQAVAALLAKSSTTSNPMPAASLWDPREAGPGERHFGWNATSSVPARHRQRVSVGYPSRQGSAYPEA